MAKKRSGGREKTLAERQAYHQQLGTRTSSATEGQEFGLGSAPNSTGRRPSPDDAADLDVPPPARRPLRRDGVNWTAVGTVLAIVAALIVTTLYVENIRSRVQVTETRINSMEKAQDAAESALRRDLQRVEAAIEKRLTELIGLFRGQGAPSSSPQSPPHR